MSSSSPLRNALQLTLPGLLGTLAAGAMAVGCSCETPPSTDAGGPDAATTEDTNSDARAMRDAPIPPGDPGRVLSIPEQGAYRIPSLEADVQVVYTEAGIPHIYASNDHDLRTVEGFLVARDRFAQLELYRRFGLGQLAELFGDVALRIDVGNRSSGRTEVADRILGLLTPEQNAQLDAYAEGVNAYIEAVRTNILPPPAELASIRPIVSPRTPIADFMEPVTRRDLVGVAATIVYFFGYTDVDLTTSDAMEDLSTQFAGDAFAAQRRNGVLIDVLQRVEPNRPITSVECATPPCYGLETSGMGGGNPPEMSQADAPMPMGLERGMMVRLQEMLARTESRRARENIELGSNAWAVAGEGTADGSAILSGDGHLPLQTAPLFYQAGFDTRVFGDAATGRRQIGMLLPGIVPMGPGTNGRIAWSQTYQEADVTDWYREAVQLDAAGQPTATCSRTAPAAACTWMPVRAIEETYTIADVPFFMSVGRTEMLRRYVTFDGRHILTMEGMPADATDTGADIINVGGTRLRARDMNSDGVIHAVSFDYTVLDSSNMLGFLFSLETAQNVDEVHTAIGGNVGYTQNMTFADANGDVLYSAYNATPCRNYLRPAGMTTGWAPGGDPRFVLDGTRFRGFEIPFGPDGRPDETSTDPQRCIIPRAQWPESLRPARGFVLTANNDLGGTSLDGDLTNDPIYVGGPWDPGYRANTIHTALTTQVAARTATIESMAGVQASHNSQLGLEYVPTLMAELDEAARLAALPPGGLTPDQTRLVALYNREGAALTQARTRLSAWLDRGAMAASGVETFYDTIDGTEREDAVATMIFNEWLRRMLDRVLTDEDIDDVLAPDRRARTLGLLHRITEGRGAGNPQRLASYNAATQESVFFDVRGTMPVERSSEAFVGALADAVRALAQTSMTAGTGGFGTTDQSQWLWGLRHQVRLESVLKVYAGDLEGLDLISGQFTIGTRRIPMAEGIAMGDPRFGIPWLPRPGDHGSVDAAAPSFAVDTDYTYGSGPVMRMVIELNAGRVRGQNILPGGNSGLPTSPFFDDQARMWVANEALPLRYELDDVVTHATGRDRFSVDP